MVQLSWGQSVSYHPTDCRCAVFAVGKLFFRAEEFAGNFQAFVEPQHPTTNWNRLAGIDELSGEPYRTRLARPGAESRHLYSGWTLHTPGGDIQSVLQHRQSKCPS